MPSVFSIPAGWDHVVRDAVKREVERINQGFYPAESFQRRGETGRVTVLLTFCEADEEGTK